MWLLQLRDFTVPGNIRQIHVKFHLFRLTQGSHEDASQIKLHLETDVDVRAIDCRTPPKGKTTIGNLVQTGTLGIGQFFVSHRFLEAGSFLPEETYRIEKKLRDA